MEHDFPEHYGEILLKLLDHSKEGRIYCHVWFNILNTILAQAVPTTQTNTVRTILLPGISPDQLRDVVRRYATDQRSLSSQDVCYDLLIIWDLIIRSNFVFVAHSFKKLYIF